MEPLLRYHKELAAQYLDTHGAVSNEELLTQIENQVFSDEACIDLIASEKRALITSVFHAFRGLDVLQPLLDDQDITEIMINGKSDIFIEKEGQVLRTNTAFESTEKLEDIIQAVVGRVNRLVNEASPIVDARLADGSRVNVVLPPIALNGPTMTIRKFPEQPMTMEDLVQRDAISEEAAQFLLKLVVAKYNLFISGGTGAGKTTFLNALAQWIPQDERLITIEDSAELQILNIPNLVRLETRNANSEGKGRIGTGELIRTALRMRPNRIIVGEVRGTEAIDMLAAMNTGHDGSFSTGHSNSCKDMLARLETMVLSGSELPIEVVRKQIASAIEVMIHVSRMKDKSRKVLEIVELAGYEAGEYILNPLYIYDDTALQCTNHSLVRARKLQDAQ